LSADNAVRIYVPRAFEKNGVSSEPRKPPAVEKLVQLEGEFENVFKCFKQVMEVCQEDKSSPPPPSGFDSDNWRGGSDVSSSTLTITWRCPLESFSILTEKVKIHHIECMAFQHVARLTNTKMNCLTPLKDNQSQPMGSVVSGSGGTEEVDDDGDEGEEDSDDDDKSNSAYEDAEGSHDGTEEGGGGEEGGRDNQESTLSHHQQLLKREGGGGSSSSSFDENDTENGSIKIEGKEDKVSNAVSLLKAIALDRKQSVEETLSQLKEPPYRNKWQNGGGGKGEFNNKGKKYKSGKGKGGKKGERTPPAASSLVETSSDGGNTTVDRGTNHKAGYNNSNSFNNKRKNHKKTSAPAESNSN
jgi:hypothetical protein